MFVEELALQIKDRQRAALASKQGPTMLSSGRFVPSASVHAPTMSLLSVRVWHEEAHETLAELLCRRFAAEKGEAR